MRSAPSLALVALLAAAAGGAAAPGPWEQPRALSGPATSIADGPGVAVARNGAVAVAWSRRRAGHPARVVEVARRRRPSVPFRPPDRLEASDGPGQAPAVAMARDGAATVAWLAGGQPRVAVAPAEGAPGAAVAIPVPSPGRALRIGVDRRGAAVALWEEPGALGPTILAAARSGGAAGFEPPARLGAPGATQPSLAIAATGEALAAWVDPDGTIQVARRDPASGAWGSPVRVSGPGPARAPRVAVNPLGDALVAWYEEAPMVAVRSRSGAWAAPQALGPAGGLPAALEPPSVAISDLESIAVSWRQGPGPLAVRLAWRRESARPFRSTTIARAGRSVGAPSVTVSFSGEVMVAWSHPLADGAQIRAQRVPFGGPRPAVERVSTGTGRRVAPALAAGLGGVVTAAWVALPSPGQPEQDPRVVVSTRRVRVV